MQNNEQIYYFLKSNGFEQVQKDNSDFFGDYYDTFSNHIYQIRFSSSKSFETVDIRSNQPNENWYDLSLVKALLCNEKELNYTTTILEHREFLKNELCNISELFNQKEYPNTRRKLDQLGNERVRQMFPEITK